jgi:folate-binding protein YgfZ
MTDTLLIRPLSGERSRLRVTGKDRKRFLHGMVSNDVQGLQPGQGCHAAMLTVKGKLLGDLVLYDQGEAGLIIELPLSAGDKVRTALDRHLIMDDAEITDVSSELAELGVYGTGAADALIAAGAGTKEIQDLRPYHAAPIQDPRGGIIAAAPELGIPGFHALGTTHQIVELQEQLLAAGAKLLSDEEAAALRITAGVPLYGADMTEEHMPAEAGLDDAISHTKGCYLGQEVVVRLRDRGHLNRRLVGLRITTPEGQEAPAAGARLAHPSRPQAGILTSIARSEHGLIGLGYVHRSAWDPGTELQLVDAAGAPTGSTAVVTELPMK